MTIAADVPSRAGQAPGQRPRLDYLPALDGIRGLGIPIVLLYHHNVTWLTGGVLAVSMFFTLSGFLITRLMIDEWQRNDRFALGKFYERRARRLFPASFVVLLLVAVAWTAFPGSGRRLGSWEWISGLTYWHNNYLQVTGKDYGGLFGLGNPLQHLWSLSLEEQVYLVFPLLMIVLLRKGRSDAALWRVFAVLTTLAAVGFFLGAWYESNGPLWNALPGVQAKCDGVACAYYATEVRAGEFLIGAAFAVLWAVWKGVPRVLELLRHPVAQVAGFGVLALEIWLWWEVGYRNDWTSFFFPWGVLINGFVVAVIMAIATAKTGICSVLSIKPLVYVGQITYTIYLVHWPVFLFIDSLKIDPDLPNVGLPILGWRTVDGFWMFWFKMMFVMAIVLAIYYLIEDPVRRRVRWSGRTLWPVLAVMALVGTVVVLAGSERRSSADDVLSTLDNEALELQQGALAGLPDIGPDAPVNASIDPTLPARVLMVGDSQSWVLASGLEGWEADAGVLLEPSPGVGCGIGENTPIRYLGIETDERAGCTAWRDTLPAIVDKLQPNVVVIVGGAADLSDRQLPGSDEWQHIGQPAYDEWLLGQMRSFADVMSASGATVLWFSNPDIDPRYQAGETGTPPFVEADPARMDRYNELIRQVAEENDQVEFADFAAAVAAHPGGQFEKKMRPDGSHIDLKYAPQLVDWIDAEIRRVHAR
jgi:peptidoglycan/LPS O-acetylase OafA/YrhL